MPYPMIYSPLYRLRSKKKLTQLLKLPSGYFNKLVNLNEQYTEFCLPKKDGKKNRYFSVPHNEAEYIQKRLFTLLERIERPEWVKAGKKGESYISNAAEHTEGKYGFKMDIAAFYDSVSFAKIRECFLKKFKMSSDIAEIMTLLVTYRRKIPTGGAASMLASYFAYEDMFIEIFDYAKEHHWKFTLYVDDLSFSSNQQFNNQNFEDINRILKKHGLYAKRKKKAIYQASEYREFTGVGINRNGKLVLPNKRRADIIDTYKSCLKDRKNLKLLNSLSGKLNSARQIEPGIFPCIAGYISNRSEELKLYRQRDSQSNLVD